MANQPLFKECEGPDAFGSVNGLIGHHKVHGLDLLAQGADSREGDDGADADVAQGGDVGAVGNLVGRKLVVHAVAGNEGNVGAVVREDLDRRGGRAPGRVRVEDGDGDEALELA